VDEMGGSCSSNVGEEELVWVIGGKETHIVDLGEVGWGGVNWIGLAEDRDKWRALVNVVMNLLVL
jgi:hypothetical protein